MTEATATAVSQALLSVFSADDPLIDFSVPEWFAPPLFVPHTQETPADARFRQNNEKDYRATATRSQWHRYLTLGRYALSGPDFDAAMEEYDSDPIKVHCLIWYNFNYHVDRYMESPPKLEAWATKFSQPYLEKHRESALFLDTKTTQWTDYAKQQSLTESWSKVTSKHRPSNKQNPKASKTSASLSVRKQPTTISEENSKASSSAQSSGGERPTQSDDTSNASVGKMSAIIPNLNVPVCDGTHRVTIRWKMPIEISRVSRQASEMKEAIYKLLTELFRDEDGHLYNWTDDGKETYNVISKMTSSEVRQFICPSLTISPSQSMAIIPLRFGFSDSTPSKWRNSEATKSILEKQNATVSISNSTSTSGNLVISGYILTKAPMTTHRLRYLQSLRKQLPDTTPPFDILLHKRSPTDLLIPHLVVQCGEKHVHALSEALMTILTGGSSAVFIPRSAFDQMSKEDAVELFQTHDTYVKALRWISLSPLLSNLDRPRTEHLEDGSQIERTTREWARSIMNGPASAKCDVVNGGTDQKAYLLFPPESGDAVYIALQGYRQSLYPFTLREARYREQVGPATSVQLSTKVIANLDFMKKLSTEMSGNSTASATEHNSQAGQSADTAATSKSVPPFSTTSSVSDVSQATMPPTPAESLRQQYRVHDQGQDASTVATEPSDSSRSTSPSKLSSSRMSTTSAKLREIDVFLHQQKEAREKNEQLASDRISQMERHLYRIQDAVKQDVSIRLTEFEDRLIESMKTQVQTSGDAMDSMNAKLEKLMSVVEKVIAGETPPAQLASEAATRPPITAADDESSCTSHSQSTVRSRTFTQTRLTALPIIVKSPDKKRLKSAGKRKLKESMKRHLELYKSKARQVSTTSDLMDTDLETPKASPSASAAEDEVESQQNGCTQTDLSEITTDLERRYTAPHKDAPTHSSGRGSKP